MDDFVEYWSAATISIRGGNPYSPEELTPLQNSAGRFIGVPVMMWNPPWTMALALPFGLLDYQTGRLAWLLFHIMILFLSASGLAIVYQIPRSKHWIAWLAVFSSGAALQALKVGQISPLFLAGLVGFLLFQQKERFFLAGVCLATLTIKPHLFYLFFLALLLWIVQTRRWRVAAGALAAAGFLSLITYIVNPSFLAQYIQAAATIPPSDSATPTPGGFLRWVFGTELLWLQFLPMLVGSSWFLLYWIKNLSGWRWEETTPLICLVSVATAPYGWVFDQVVLVVPLLQAGVWLTRTPGKKTVKISLLAAYLAINMLVMIPIPGLSQFWLFWVTPVYLLLYLAARGTALQGQERTAGVSVL